MKEQLPRTQGYKALALLAKGGMARLREFKAAGVAEETVVRLVREGQIVRLARGLYQRPGAKLAANHTLAEAAKLVPQGVVCLISALQFHGLTVQTPSAVWVAIDRTARKPRISYPPIRFVRFGGRARTLGVAEHRIEGVSVRIFDAAKTVVDCFRYRHKIGLDVALEGMREALRQRRCKPDDIRRYAVACRAWSVVRPYLEAMAADAA
ncbi:MAG: transcriptional regulator [Acidimicrobiia bacterium]|nr:transcriptional regulator [Acidimicrobiia bacterium]